MGILKNVLSGGNEIKKFRSIVDSINGLEGRIQRLTDAELRGNTDTFRKAVAQGTSLDELLPQAFATVREAAKRTLGLRHYDVQLMGGIVLHQGRIAEMKTGEGKTLVSTLPAYLNALSGKGVHLVTVNDYLARRDSEWMGKVYRFLGMSVGLIVHDMDAYSRHAAYGSDITYGTNNEYGFDYLRDNMAIHKSDTVQRGLNYAIVDEVDSILVDEARTPLIISGMAEKSTEMYQRADRFAAKLHEDDDFTMDEKLKALSLTEQGIKKAEQYFGIENLSDISNMEVNHHINQAMRARFMMRRDRDYVVQEGEVLIVDEFTGRIMVGRRYSEGLHQAIEAKEGVKVARENKTLATITFQNFFRMYDKLAGMTGTAKTEEEEFQDIYNLDVVEVPTNEPVVRIDHNDVVYATEEGKFKAVVADIADCQKRGQPVLVGTVSVEKSETLSGMLRRQGVRHEVLNAKFHQKEAEIVSQAGKLGAVTIATNMAGRGTDILLGGNPGFMTRLEMRRMGYSDELIEEADGKSDTADPEILAARAMYNDLLRMHKQQTDAEHQKVTEVGGLHIIGTERHESRRIDNQLRGRSGRQGDPGSTRFYIALEDEVMRLFGSERIKSLMGRISPEDDMALDYKFLSKQIESAQKRVESRNYEIRKTVLQYDDVMNQQREIIYSQRQQVLGGEDVKGDVDNMVDAYIDRCLKDFYAANAQLSALDWDVDSLNDRLVKIFSTTGDRLVGRDDLQHAEREQIKEAIRQRVRYLYEAREQLVAENGGDMREVERVVLLRCVDRHWIDHIDTMDQLRKGIGLRAYGQRNPAMEYRFEGFDMFDEMIQGIQQDTLMLLYHVNVQERPQEEVRVKITATSHGGDDSVQKHPVRAGDKVGRNSPCPCGSGKKYKNCCGAS